MYPFVRQVVDFVEAHALIAPGARVLIALSGGPDSCALLIALREAADKGLLPLPAAAAHFHHGLRGADADADAAFAAALCARLAVPCFIGLGAVAAERAEPKNRRAPNDAARHARYAFLEQAAMEAGADVIATGHTADDQAETVLLRVLRGTGTDGLSGIPARRLLRPGLAVVRPLLRARRAEIEAYCRDRGVTPRRDPSNKKTSYPRARMRALLPQLARDFNPRLTEALERLARSAALDADLMEGLTDALWQRTAVTAPGRVHLDGGALRNEHPALRRRVLLRALQQTVGDTAAAAGENAVTESNVEILDDLLRAGQGAADLPGGIHARVAAAAAVAGLTLTVAVAWASPAPYAVRLPVPGRIWLRPAALYLRTEWSHSPGTYPRARRALAIEAAYGTMGDERPPVLEVRSLRAGDRIAPLGMGGKTRLVRDMMADAGWPAPCRVSAPLVVRRDSGEVWWIVGLAQSEATRVGPGTKSSVLRITADLDC